MNAETGSASPDTPAGWREALLALTPEADPCPGFRPGAWARVWAGALGFIERHGDEAHGLGWTAQELFGVHPVVGVIRVDFTGALLLTVAGRVLAVEASAIRYTNGLTFAAPLARERACRFGRSGKPMRSVVTARGPRRDQIHRRPSGEGTS